MTDTTPAIDVIDELADITEGGALDVLRLRRPVTRAQLQASSGALFTPLDDTEVSVAERLLVAAFATRLTAEDATAARYAALAATADAERAAIVLAEAAAAAAPGPFGRYAEAGLHLESLDGPRYSPSPEVTDAVGERLAAALAHAQLLVSRPREASGEALDRLLEAGWSTDGIITLSQLISFLAFQQRVAAGLRVLAASAGASDIDDTEASRVNGCVFCASVHARFAAHFSKRPDLVDQLLAEGIQTDLGERWNAITDAATALTLTPIGFGPQHVDRLRAAGLDNLEISDVVHGAAFFNWANRLLLSIGRPVAPPDEL